MAIPQIEPTLLKKATFRIIPSLIIDDECITILSLKGSDPDN